MSLWYRICVTVFAVLPVAAVSYGTPTNKITRFADLRAELKVTGKILENNPQGNRWGGKGGLWMGNAELALSLWGPPDKITCSVKKTDVWDRRHFPDPVITIEDYKAGNYPEVLPEGNQNRGKGYYAYGSYDFPCPKPVGQIILMIPDLKGAPALEAEQHYSDAMVETALINSKGASLGSLHSFIMGSENLYVMHVKSANLTQPVSVRLYKHQDTIEFGKSFVAHHILYPEREEAAPAFGYNYNKDVPDNGPVEPPTAGKDGKFFWIRQNLPPSATLPEGFSYVMMGVVDCPDVILETVENQKGLGAPPYREDETIASVKNEFGDDQKLIDEVWGLRPRYESIREANGVAATARISTDQAGDFTVYVTVVTSLDAKDPLAAARKNLDRAIRRGYSKLLTDQRRWWVDWYESFEESRMIFSDDETNKSMIAGQFYEGISTKPDAYKLQGDAGYARMEQDWAPWHGDNHFNEPDIGLNHTDLFVANRPDCPELKRWYSIVEAYFPGAKLNAKQVYNCPGACYGMVYVPISPVPVYHCHVKWEQSMHQSAQIVKLLWLKYEYTGDEQWLKDHAYPVMRELAIFYAAYVKKEDDGYFHLDPTVAAENRGIEKDTADGVTMVKYHLRATARAAKILGVDEDKCERWLNIADNMPPYGTYEREEGTVYVNSPGSHPIKNNFSTPLIPVTLGDEIGLDSPPEVIEIAKRTAQTEDAWRGTIDAPLKRLGVYVEKSGITPSNMLQSHTGKIRLFPAVPDDFEGGFRKFLAMGAFEVTAYRDGAKITDFTITSRKGNPCTIVNPWPNNKISIIDTTSGKEVKAQEKGVSITFLTEQGHLYVVQNKNLQKGERK